MSGLTGGIFASFLCHNIHLQDSHTCKLDCFGETVAVLLKNIKPTQRLLQSVRLNDRFPILDYV